MESSARLNRPDSNIVHLSGGNEIYRWMSTQAAMISIFIVLTLKDLNDCVCDAVLRERTAKNSFTLTLGLMAVRDRMA